MTNAEVRGRQLAINKLAALTLLTSQGSTMIHSGQEWARSKVIADTNVPDDHVGLIDHNSYNKDNETNWLNWDEKDQNQELVKYYRGLIELRKMFPEFRRSQPADYKFTIPDGNVAVVYQLKDKLFVVLNGERKKQIPVKLPKGKWHLLVDGKSVNLNTTEIITGEITVPATSGMVFSLVGNE